MDFWKVVGVPVRRWYVLLPVLLGAILAAAAAYTSAPPVYTSKVTLVLTTSPTGGTEYSSGFVPNPVNPLLMYDHGVALAGALLVQGMRTPEFTERIGLSENSGPSLTVTNGDASDYQVVNGPFVQLVAQAASPDDTQALLERAVAAAREELERRQSALDVPPTTSLTLTEVVPAAEPLGGKGGGARSAAVVLGLGGVASVIGAFVAESLLVARRDRTAEPRHACPVHSTAST